MSNMLPVGSKVKLKDGRILVIIGYLPNKPNDEKLYDYICCRNIYGIRHKKEDLVLDRDYFYINNEDISEILYIGYSDDEFDLFSHYTDLVKENIRKTKKNNKKLSEEEIKGLYTNILDKVNKEIGGDKDEK